MVQPILFDGCSTDEVLLNDALQDLRRAGVIPDVIGMYHSDRTLQAHSQAVGLGTINAPLLIKVKLFQSTLQILPALGPLFRRAALWFAGSCAEKDVTFVRSKSAFSGLLGEMLFSGHYADLASVMDSCAALRRRNKCRLCRTVAASA